MGMKNLGAYKKGSSNHTAHKRTAKFKSKGMTYDTHGMGGGMGIKGYGHNSSDYVSRGSEKMGGTSRSGAMRGGNKVMKKSVDHYRKQPY